MTQHTTLAYAWEQAATIAAAKGFDRETVARMKGNSAHEAALAAGCTAEIAAAVATTVYTGAGGLDQQQEAA